MEEVLPWYIAGPLIGLIVPLLLLLREKQFGISSSYRFIGSKIFKKIDYFNYKSGADKNEKTVNNRIIWIWMCRNRIIRSIEPIQFIGRKN